MFDMTQKLNKEMKLIYVAINFLFCFLSKIKMNCVSVSVQ
jgi:hypothetical protein